MSKRSGDCSVSSNEKQKASKSCGNFDLEVISHEEFVIRTEAELRMYQSVVSLSFIGYQEHFQYTGLVIESSPCATRFLTSATALRSKQNDRMVNVNVSIHVNLPNGQMRSLSLQEVDFDRNIAVISMGPSPYFKEANLFQPSEVGFGNIVVAICCSGAREIITLTGEVTEKSTELYGQRLNMSTCHIPEYGVGGPLVDFAGIFVGMNMSHVNNGGTLFLPWETVLESFVLFRITRYVCYNFIFTCSNMGGTRIEVGHRKPSKFDAQSVTNSLRATLKHVTQESRQMLLKWL